MTMMEVKTEVQVEGENKHYAKGKGEAYNHELRSDEDERWTR